MEDTSRQFYDNYVTRQAKIGINRRHKSILMLCKKYGLKTSDKVLEIGCGIGTVSRLIGDYLEEGKLVALDTSTQSIAYAKENIQNSNIEFQETDLTRDTLDDKFDFIVMPDVLEHIPIEKHPNLFSNLRKVSNTDTTILIHIPNPHFLSWFLEYKPDLAQEIDQPLYGEKIFGSIFSNDFYIHHIENYSLWFQPADYQYLVIRPNQSYTFEEIHVPQKGILERIKNGLLRVFR